MPDNVSSRPTVKSLYYYNKKLNFGDQIGADITAHVLGKELPPVEEGQGGVLFSCGSIIHAAKHFESVVVWGSGIEPHYGDFDAADRTTILAVRGPLSAKHVGYEGGVFGDPAILAPRLLPHEPEPDRSGVSVVPHHMTMDMRMRDKVFFNPYRSGFRVIDPRREWREVVMDIRSSEFVFAQSLHGAILSEAYGIPWAWWRGWHGRFATFKWNDWFASIKREPKHFGLRQLSKARRHAESVRSEMPDLDRLEDALRSGVTLG